VLRFNTLTNQKLTEDRIGLTSEASYFSFTFINVLSCPRQPQAMDVI